MSNIPGILRSRHRRNKKYDNTPLRRTGLGVAILVSMAIALFAILGTALYASLTRDLPPLATLPLLLEPPNGLLLQPTRFYDRSGEHILLEMDNPALSARNYTPIDKFPEELITATLATRDPDFWQHPGFTVLDPRIKAEKTITQQLVSDLLLWDEPDSVWRGARERLLASQITANFGRTKILEWYLNSAYYGNRIYGAAAAAEVYLGKEIAELELSDAAILAAIAQSPSLNPFNAPDTILEAGHTVLETMQVQGYLSAAEVTEAQTISPRFQTAPAQKTQLAPAFVNLVWEQLTPNIPAQRLERGGFNIITTIDYDLQQQAVCATQNHLQQLAGAVIATENCAAARLLPALALENTFPAGALDANIVALDPLTGQVLAMVGETTPGRDPAHLPGHAPGSLLTPFVYLTAFTRGFTPASLLWDIPTVFGSEINQLVQPDNAYQGPVRLRLAMVNDYLTPALATMNQIGAENVWRTIGQFGISAQFETSANNLPECPGCAYLLGEGEVTLLEMTQAYGILAHEGNFAGQIQPGDDGPELSALTFTQVTDTHGQIWFSNSQADTQPVTGAQLAYLINHMLSDEAARWPSLGHPNSLEIGRPTATKMGMTAQGTDSWTVGYTPQLVVGVWLGTDAADSPHGGAPTPQMSAALWRAIMQYATRDLPSESWQAPLGINTLTVCDPSGMLPTAECPSLVSEVFLSGHEPTQADTLFRVYEVNRETGRLATVFTPPELIEARVYMLVPPEANSWAAQSAILAPPSAYDVIHMPDPSTEAEIIAPQIFTTITGNVEIQGSATGTDFTSYRLQVGQGLNPQSWLAITDDITTPVRNQWLGSWDTRDLNGLYAIQLIVLRSGQRVDTHTIQVTVDNLPPDAAIIYPEEGQVFEYQPATPITFQVQASDNLGLLQIEYLLDDQALDIQIQPPFALPWLPRIGEHTLTIRAIDLAGNEYNQSVAFSVQRSGE
ncbi:MAG: hypothetical protein HN413_07660 [Chloroflexi bacterium]|jgi:membrane peptidoglycan carboxypeptidase|nr:hypothetical protein [Chloroflexota bacterium]